MSRRFSLSDAPFAGRTGAGVTVAVIDSGVHAAHPHVGEVAESACIDPPTGDSVDRLGHGTAVAAAIRDLAPAARLIVGKVFDRTLATNADALARGIEWAASRGAHVINLSLGTTNRAHEERLRESIGRAADAGALVVSAREADGVVWLPGSLPGVVSVVADQRLDRDELVLDGGVMRAAPYPRPIPGVPKERNLSGVSFAVANVSGFLARLLETRSDLRAVGDILHALIP
ncbi:MAG: S8 family serine peptidase [Gemmatimonadaceae bacterium]